MTIRAIISDMGGVLIRTVDSEPRRKLAERLGVTLSELYNLVFDCESARQATLGKISAVQHLENTRTALSLSVDEFQSVWSEFWIADRLDTELINDLCHLRKHYKTALLSNAWDDLRFMINDRWGIADAFDQIIISAEVGVAKPDTRIYQIALERLDVSPHEAVFIDDFPENITAANTVGLHAIHFRNISQARAELDAFLNGDTRKK